jgi:dTDP-4-amino-4,6-dideoxygalactose transaminase
MSNDLSRRTLLGVLSLGATMSSLKGTGRSSAPAVKTSTVDKKPALLGGDPIRTEPFPSWPVIENNDRAAWKTVLDEGKWNRGPSVARFEKEWAAQLGSPHVVATASGTAALYTALFALNIGPGDEVIIPPYTFVATLNVVLLRHALPVFVDTDRSTLQIDANKIESAISDQTRCIMPVHLGGNVANMDTILKIGQKHDIPVLEDACQAHLAEWRNKKVGSVGDVGCFSLQASKNLNSGEGGIICGRDGEVMSRCAGFQDAGRGYTVGSGGEMVVDRNSEFAYATLGDNRRMTEFQGALLLEQLTRLEEQARRREDNADHLTSQLKEIEGILPAEMYEGCTRNAYHLYMFRYNPKGFSGLPRSRFVKALRAEGIPCGGGYSPLNKEPFIERTLNSPGFRRIYGADELAKLKERNRCPQNDRLCTEAVWFGQTQLLGPQSDMDQIAAAVRKIRDNAKALSA